MSIRTRIPGILVFGLAIVAETATSAAAPVAAVAVSPVRAASQAAAPAPPAPQPGSPQAAAPVPDPNAPPISPGELTRLFDAYAVLQAQSFLKLDDDQYGEFVVRLKALQDGRRKRLGERSRLIGELRRLTAPDSTATDAAIRTTFDALQREDAAAHADLAKAYENLDSVLDPRQQARFRVFEDQIERQKLNLLSRVRRRAAQNPKP